MNNFNINTIWTTGTTTAPQFPQSLGPNNILFPNIGSITFDTITRQEFEELKNLLMKMKEVLEMLGLKFEQVDAT